MRLVDVSKHGSGRDPRTDDHRSTYRRGIAVCETPDGDTRHGPFLGFTSDLEADPVVWLAWDQLRENDHTAIPKTTPELDRLYGPKTDTDQLRANLNLPHGQRIGTCQCGGEIRYDPDEDDELCLNDCPEPRLWARDGQPANVVSKPAKEGVA